MFPALLDTFTILVETYNLTNEVGLTLLTVLPHSVLNFFGLTSESDVGCVEKYGKGLFVVIRGKSVFSN